MQLGLHVDSSMLVKSTSYSREEEELMAHNGAVKHFSKLECHFHTLTWPVATPNSGQERHADKSAHRLSHLLHDVLHHCYSQEVCGLLYSYVVCNNRQDQSLLPVRSAFSDR